MDEVLILRDANRAAGRKTKLRSRYLVIDNEDSAVLGATYLAAIANSIPDILRDVRILVAGRAIALPEDIESGYYTYAITAEDADRIQPLNTAQITARKKERKNATQYALLSMEELFALLKQSRRSLERSDKYETMVFLQIERELRDFERGERRLPYTERYAHVHAITLEEAYSELNIDIAARNHGLQRTQELFWAFKKQIMDNPPQNLEESAELKRKMRSEFILTYRI